MSRFKTLEQMVDAYMRSYIPTAFNEEFSLVQKVNKIITYLNDVIAQQNEVSDFVDETTTTQNASIQSVRDDFETLKKWAEDEGLRDKLEDVLTDWDNDGTLDNIINLQIFSNLNTLIGQKRDKSVKILGTDLDTSSDLNKVKLINLADEVKQAMAGTTSINATVGANSVTNDKIANSSITYEKTGYLATGKNLFNKRLGTDGQYIYYLTGQFNGNAAYGATDYIPITGNTQYSYNTGFVNAHFAFYDINKVYITNSTNTLANPFTTPSNAYYMRLTYYLAAKDTAQVEKGSLVTSYEAYQLLTMEGGLSSQQKTQVTNVLLTTQNTIKNVKESTFGKNLFNPYTAVTGKYVNYVGGALADNVSYNASDYIVVKPSTNYSWSFLRMMAWYDSNYSFISGFDSSISTGQNPGTALSPSNAAFARVTVTPGNMYSYQFEESSSPTNFESYGYTLAGLKNASGKDDFLLFLPSEICIAVGRTIELYNSQVCWTGNINNYHFKWECSIGKAMKRKWTFTGVAEKIGSYTLTCTVYDNNMNTVATASSTVKVVANTMTNNKKVLPIGDSLTNAKPWLAEVINLSNNKISFVGTRWNGDVQGGTKNHEGRSGASAGWYLSNSTYTFDTVGVTANNPFWNPSSSKFDYAYYKSTYNINPDIIQLYLGTNGIALDATLNAGNIKAIVDGIRVTDASIPIYVVFTLYRGDQNGIGNQLSTDGYSAGSGVWKLEEDRKVYNLMVKVNELLKTYSNLYFIPVALTHDSENNFKSNTATPVNSRSTITEVVDAEATHPSPRNDGYYQMADIMYSTIVAHSGS